MFSGIIEDIGVLREKEWHDGPSVWRLGVETSLPVSEIKIGESISNNGACLTIIKTEGNRFFVDVSVETADKSNLTMLENGDRINLERALQLSQRLNGHIVMGHCDGKIRRLDVRKVGEGAEIWYELPRELRRYVIVKGSVSINGVSLTVNSVGADRFSIFLIPHTIRETNLLDKSSEIVNIEVDMLGKYIEQLMSERV